MKISNKVRHLCNQKENLIFLFHDLYCEQYIKAFLKKNSEKKSSIIFENLKIIENLNLEETQREAMINCLKNKMFLICGGAGTGKTTSLVMFITFMLQMNYIKSVVFTSPTNKALNVIKNKFINSLYYLLN